MWYSIKVKTIVCSIFNLVFKTLHQIMLDNVSFWHIVLSWIKIFETSQAIIWQRLPNGSLDQNLKHSIFWSTYIKLENKFYFQFFCSSSSYPICNTFIIFLLLSSLSLSNVFIYCERFWPNKDLPINFFNCQELALACNSSSCVTFHNHS